MTTTDRERECRGGPLGVEQINWQNVGTKKENKDMSAIKSAYKNILLCMRRVNKLGMDKSREPRTEKETGNRAKRGNLMMVCEQWGRIQQQSPQQS